MSNLNINNNAVNYDQDSLDTDSAQSLDLLKSLLNSGDKDQLTDSDDTTSSFMQKMSSLVSGKKDDDSSNGKFSLEGLTQSDDDSDSSADSIQWGFITSNADFQEFVKYSGSSVVSSTVIYDYASAQLAQANPEAKAQIETFSTNIKTQIANVKNNKDAAQVRENFKDGASTLVTQLYAQISQLTDSDNLTTTDDSQSLWATDSYTETTPMMTSSAPTSLGESSTTLGNTGTGESEAISNYSSNTTSQMFLDMASGQTSSSNIMYYAIMLFLTLADMTNTVLDLDAYNMSLTADQGDFLTESETVFTSLSTITMPYDTGTTVTTGTGTDTVTSEYYITDMYTLMNWAYGGTGETAGASTESIDSLQNALDPLVTTLEKYYPDNMSQLETDGWPLPSSDTTTDGEGAVDAELFNNVLTNYVNEVNTNINEVAASSGSSLDTISITTTTVDYTVDDTAKDTGSYTSWSLASNSSFTNAYAILGDATSAASAVSTTEQETYQADETTYQNWISAVSTINSSLSTLIRSLWQ